MSWGPGVIIKRGEGKGQYQQMAALYNAVNRIVTTCIIRKTVCSLVVTARLLRWAMRGAECDAGTMRGLDWLITPVCWDQGIMTLITWGQWSLWLTQTPGTSGGVHQPLCQDNASYATRDSSSEWLSSIFTVDGSSWVLTDNNFTYSTESTSTGLGTSVNAKKSPFYLFSSLSV